MNEPQAWQIHIRTLPHRRCQRYHVLSAVWRCLARLRFRLVLPDWRFGCCFRLLIGDFDLPPRIPPPWRPSFLSPAIQLTPEVIERTSRCIPTLHMSRSGTTLCHSPMACGAVHRCPRSSGFPCRGGACILGIRTRVPGRRSAGGARVEYWCG
jgi:hypothetical protein